jgi:hypothetical protein
MKYEQRLTSNQTTKFPFQIEPTQAALLTPCGGISPAAHEKSCTNEPNRPVNLSHVTCTRIPHSQFRIRALRSLAERKEMSTISPARVAANRRNARKSTGPRTAAGKKKSSQNARKHGLYSRYLIPDRRSESSRAFQSMLKDFILEMQPKNSLDRVWVERIVLSLWRLQGAYRLEARAAQGDSESAPLPALNCLPKLVRYENMLDRQFQSAYAAFNPNKLPLRQFLKKSPDGWQSPRRIQGTLGS